MQNKNAVPFAQKLLRISRQWKRCIKPTATAQVMHTWSRPCQWMSVLCSQPQSMSSLLSIMWLPCVLAWLSWTSQVVVPRVYPHWGITGTLCKLGLGICYTRNSYLPLHPPEWTFPFPGSQMSFIPIDRAIPSPSSKSTLPFSPSETFFYETTLPKESPE